MFSYLYEHANFKTSEAHRKMRTNTKNKMFLFPENNSEPTLDTTLRIGSEVSVMKSRKHG